MRLSAACTHDTCVCFRSHHLQSPAVAKEKARRKKEVVGYLTFVKEEARRMDNGTAMELNERI